MMLIIVVLQHIHPIFKVDQMFHPAFAEKIAT